MKTLAVWAPAPDLNVISVEQLEAGWLVAVGSLGKAAGPVCGTKSTSRHSSYRRMLRDLSDQGAPVLVHARLSRWRCRNDQCDRRIFADRLPGLAAPVCTPDRSAWMTLSGSLVIARRAAIRKTDGPARHANERHGNLAAFVRQMRDQGMTATLVGSAGIATQEFATIAGESAEGTFMTYGSDRLKRPEAQKVAQRFKAKSFDAEVWTLYSYASVQVLKQAAEAAQSLEPHTIAAAIHSGMSLKTAIGDLSFDKRGMQGKNLRS